MNVGPFDSFVTRHWYNAAARVIWSDAATLQTWLDVEVALASAQAELGIIPADAAQIIRARADATAFDLERLSREIAFAQHPFVPALRQFEERCGEPAAGYIHWGATTQNIFDTANSLQMAKSHRLMVDFLVAAITRLSALAQEHKHTLQVGRTHGQHALPMTFGFKVAGWIAELDRDQHRLEQRLAGSFVACMGGAIGTFAAVGEKGPAVEQLMARKLGLAPAGLPMRSSFDRVGDYVTALGVLAGTVERIAHDLVFLQRTEIGEVEEAFHMGKVGSSTMAQKRNPSTALMLISMSRLLRAKIPLVLESMVRMDEGDSSATNISDAILPEIGVLAVSLAETLEKLVNGLVIHPDVMKRNAGMTNGLIVSEALMMRLTATMGRHHAHQFLYEAAQCAIAGGIPFSQALHEHRLLGGESFRATLGQALAVENYIGESARLVDAVVARVHRTT